MTKDEDAQILYTAIAKKEKIMVEHNNPLVRHGTHKTAVISMLKKFPPQNSRMLFTYEDQYNFCCEVHNGFSYVVLCDMKFSTGVTYNYINDLKDRWAEFYRDMIRYEDTTAKDFKQELSERMHYFNTDPGADKIKRLKNEIADVKDKMVTNLDKALLRGEKIEVILGKTEDLVESSTVFQGKTKSLKYQMIWQRIAVTALILFIIVVVCTGLFFYLCGGIACIRRLQRNNN